MKRKILCALLLILLALGLFPIESVAEGESILLASWADLTTLAATGSSLNYDEVSSSCTLLSGVFEITGAFEIPSGGSLQIENGAALSATGEGSQLINNGTILVNGGSLSVTAPAAYSQGDSLQRVTNNGGTVTGIDEIYMNGGDGFSRSSGDGSVISIEELHAALAAATDPDTTYPIRITDSVELDDSLIFAANISVSVLGTLTVPAGKTLTVKGILSVEGGMLINNGNIVNAGTVYVGGVFENNGAFAVQGNGRVVPENGGSITGTNGNAVAILKGDVNGDGYIRNDDVKCILSYRIGDAALDEAQLSYGDMNNDSGVDLMDALLLCKILPEGEWSHVYP